MGWPCLGWVRSSSGRTGGGRGGRPGAGASDRPDSETGTRRESQTARQTANRRDSSTANPAILVFSRPSADDAALPTTAAMPFHSHHHSSGQFTPSQGLGQAAQALGSIGAPTGNLRIATSGTTSAGTDALMPASGNVQSPAAHTAPPSASGLAAPGAQQQQQPGSVFESRRAPTLGRNEELHISTTSSQPSASSGQQQQQQHHLYNSPDQYSAGAAPNVHLHQATPQQQPSQYSSAPASTINVPGSLQPGSSAQQQQQQLQQPQQRPAPSAAYTAPSTVPTMPPLNTNAQQYTLPTRSNTIHQPQHSSSHAYSRSSPAGLGPDQKYIPFSSTPEQPKYAAATPSQKYYPSTPSGAASSSPLGLADIRPRANSTMADESSGAGTLFTDVDSVPSNSSYLTPWPAYAFDWCKWNVHGGNGAGKMAVGSYLEDNHNFVCFHAQSLPSLS